MSLGWGDEVLVIAHQEGAMVDEIEVLLEDAMEDIGMHLVVFLFGIFQKAAGFLKSNQVVLFFLDKFSKFFEWELTICILKNFKFVDLKIYGYRLSNSDGLEMYIFQEISILGK